MSDEFRAYRGELRGYLTTATREVKVQEDFGVGAATLLEMLDDYIGAANAVLHLVGKSAGSKPRPAEVRNPEMRRFRERVRQLIAQDEDDE